jgi:hypothetical protein
VAMANPHGPFQMLAMIERWISIVNSKNGSITGRLMTSLMVVVTVRNADGTTASFSPVAMAWHARGSAFG